MSIRSKLGQRVNRRLAIALAACVSLSACTAMPSGAAPVKEAATNGGPENRSAAKGVDMAVLHRAKGQGKNYEWGKDHIFVKLSSAETDWAFTLVQDNLKPGFDLGLHLHRTHTEIFYILDGEVQFTIGKEPFTARTGSVVYIPGGTPHAAASPKGGKMLMFFAPGGFDEMLAEIDNASWFQRLNPFASARRNEKYDIHKTSDGAQSTTGGPAPRRLTPGEGEPSNSGAVVKLSESDTNGLGRLTEETLAPGVQRQTQSAKDQTETVYVLNGKLEFESAGIVHAATTGATIHFPPGVPANIMSPDGAKVLVYRTTAGRP